jgi:hypothetical protein
MFEDLGLLKYYREENINKNVGCQICYLHFFIYPLYLALRMF